MKKESTALALAPAEQFVALVDNPNTRGNSSVNTLVMVSQLMICKQLKFPARAAKAGIFPATSRSARLPALSWQPTPSVCIGPKSLAWVENNALPVNRKMGSQGSGIPEAPAKSVLWRNGAQGKTGRVRHAHPSTRCISSSLTVPYRPGWISR